MNGYNNDIKHEQINKLKQLFPEVVTEGKIDWQKLQAILGEAVDLGERYGLSWKGKSDVFAAIQEKTVQTLHPDRANSVDWDTTSNMFIEGDNLAALKILHKAYYGKVKMIYIDPPYNTGNDFIYNDDFKQTRRSYEAEAGITDDEGNVVRDDGLRTNTGGHKHSNWLNMMYPRLFLARNLLRQDGVIFVSIDDNEVHNLRLMMNEIFGEENFVGELAIIRAEGGGLAKQIVQGHEYLLIFSRNINNFDPLKRPKDIRGKIIERDGKKFWLQDDWLRKEFGKYGTLPYEDIEKVKGHEKKIEVDEGIKRGKYQLINKGNYHIVAKLRPVDEDGSKFYSVIKHLSADGKRDINSLGFGEEFSFPKPVSLIKELVLGATFNTKANDDIILDFFSGSGTTAHAVAELNAEDGGNRRWICVQLPELTDEKSEAYKAGYRTIADIACERIRRAGTKIRADQADKLASRDTPLDLGFRAYRVDDSNFKQWNELVSGPEEIRQQALANLEPLEEGATDDDLLTELLLKRGISPLAQIEQHDNFCFIPSEKLAICLAHSMTEELFTAILATKPSSIILLDRAFGENVNLKVNLLLQAERQSVEVEVV